MILPCSYCACGMKAFKGINGVSGIKNIKTGSDITRAGAGFGTR